MGTNNWFVFIPRIDKVVAPAAIAPSDIVHEAPGSSSAGQVFAVIAMGANAKKAGGYILGDNNWIWVGHS